MAVTGVGMSECSTRRYNANEHKSTRGSESVALRFGVGSAQEYPWMAHRVENLCTVASGQEVRHMPAAGDARLGTIPASPMPSQACAKEHVRQAGGHVRPVASEGVAPLNKLQAGGVSIRVR